MTFRAFSIGLAAAVSLSLSPVWAQERGRPADSPSTGSAVPRGSDSGSSSSSSSSNSGSNSGSGASSSPSSSGSWMDNSSHRVETPRAPVRPEQFNASADQRRSNGATSGRAVPRNEGTASGSSSSTSATSGSSGPSRDRSSTAVPAYSRPRDDRNVTGRAVPRTGPVPDDDHNHFHGGYYPYYPGYIYDPYYSFYYDPFYSTRYGYWAPYGYGYGLGYFSYD